MSKLSKSQKRSVRRKLSKLLKYPQKIKKRLPTCKSSISFTSKKDYNRKDGKKVCQKDLSD